MTTHDRHRNRHLADPIHISPSSLLPARPAACTPLRDTRAASIPTDIPRSLAQPISSLPLPSGPHNNPASEQQDSGLCLRVTHHNSTQISQEKGG